MITNGHRAVRHWPVLLLLFWILVGGIQQTRSTIVLYALALICAFIAVQSEPPVIYVAMFGMGVFLLTHLLRRVHNAYAVTPFMRMANVTREWRSKFRHQPLTLHDGASKSQNSGSTPAPPAPSEKVKVYAS